MTTFIWRLQTVRFGGSHISNHADDYFLVYVQSLDDCPGDCFLSTVFPTRKIEPHDNLKTLSDFGIKNNEQLMVQAITGEFSDESEDDSDWMYISSTKLRLC